MTTAEALALVRESLGELSEALVDVDQVLAALALIEERMEELERKERVNSGLTRNLSVVQTELEKAEADCEEYLRRILGWQDRAEKAEAERDEARRINEFDIHVVVAELRRERDELEAALREIAERDYIGVIPDDGDVPWATIARRALGGGE